jgi:hypothetical protein
MTPTTADRSLKPFTERRQCANKSHSTMDMTRLLLPQIGH